MYRTGDTVFYGAHGICEVTGREVYSEKGERVCYLVLQPVKQNNARFLIPENNARAMGILRSVLPVEEFEKLLEADESKDIRWTADENKRKQLYRTMISGGDPSELIQMIRLILIHRKQMRTAGRKLHLCDEAFLRDAERLLAEELSFIMKISWEDGLALLRSKLQ